MPCAMKVRALLAAVGLALSLGACEVQLGETSSAPSTASPPPTKSGEISVAIKVVVKHGNTVVVVPVKVAGKGPYDFVLDTGASMSALDKVLVRKLHLRKTGANAQVTGVTGTSLLPVVRVPSWSVGGQSLNGHELPMIDLGGDYSGLLGSDELRHFGAVRIDFRAARLVLKDR
jgi:predicted aspartyl protease